MNFTESTEIKIPADVHFIYEEGEGAAAEAVTILNYKEGRTFGLKGVGFDFWQILQDEPNLSVICDRLSAMYKVPKDVLWKDIGGLVANLVQAGLLAAE